MGDNFSKITRSTIVNRSLVTGALNRVEHSDGETAAEALRQLVAIVESSGNNEAVEYLDTMNEELQKEAPRKSILRSMWNGIIQVLPTVSQVTSVAGEIEKLIV